MCLSVYVIVTAIIVNCKDCQKKYLHLVSKYVTYDLVITFVRGFVLVNYILISGYKAYKLMMFIVRLSVHIS
jgi:hypothetical protein